MKSLVTPKGNNQQKGCYNYFSQEVNIKEGIKISFLLQENIFYSRHLNVILPLNMTSSNSQERSGKSLQDLENLSDISTFEFFMT